MMNYVCAYEVVALFLIGLVTFFYHYKNWLPMYKNSFFSSILHILLVVIFFDIMNRMENLGIIELPDAVAGVLTLSSYIGVIISAGGVLYVLSGTDIKAWFPQKQIFFYNVYTGGCDGSFCCCFGIQWQSVFGTKR